MFDKLTEMRQVAKEPSSSEYVQALVTVLVELEHSQLEAVAALHDAQDLDDPVAVHSTREARKASLLALADEVAQGNLRGYWLDQFLAEHDVANVEDAKALAGLSDDAWGDQMAAWASMYRSEAPDRFEDVSDREIAAEHVRETFDVDLDTFERGVVNYSRKDVLKQALAGNFQTVEAGIRASEEHARASSEVAADSSNSTSEVAADGDEVDA